MAETRKLWYVLGHPAWPSGVDFPTPKQAETFYWEHPKLDGTREGMTIVRIDTVRYEAYTPTTHSSESEPRS